ncbi:MAG: VOC family protein [Bacteroidetes bacterium]|nr:VOC family protein [Bacteroidota bacterium]
MQIRWACFGCLLLLLACHAQRKAPALAEPVSIPMHPVPAASGKDIEWFELPATDMDRAQTFYEQLLGSRLERLEFPGVQMAFLPRYHRQRVSGAVVRTSYLPGPAGTLLYLNAGKELGPMQARMLAAGGRLIQPPATLTPGGGQYLLFEDTEGNTVALHSPMADRNEADMHDLHWFEIPVTDLERAADFYAKVLGYPLVSGEVNGYPAAFLAHAAEPGSASGALVQHPLRKPSQIGPIAFLYCAEDQDRVHARIVQAGGSIVLAKTRIGDVDAYYSLFLDSEGNRVGLQGPR